MPIVTVHNVGEIGIVRDRQPHDLPPNAWSNGNNIRFREKTARRIQGDEGVWGTPSVDPLFLMPWLNGATRFWLYASGAKIHRTDGSVDVDMTRSTGGDYNGGSDPGWTGGVFGGVPVLNNDSGSDYPQMWDGSNNFQDLTGWPANTYVKCLRTFKNQMIGLHVTDATGIYPTKIMISDTADPGTVPTTWVAAGDNRATARSFSETTGEVRDGMALGDLFVVYKEDSTWLMRYVGGQFIYQSAQAFRTLGILARNCVAEFEKKHFVVTRGDVIVHNGSDVSSIIDELNRDTLFSLIDSEYIDNVQVIVNEVNTEIWIAFPTSGSSGLKTKAAIWNWRNQTWSFRDLDSLAYGASGVLVEVAGVQAIDDMTFPINDWTWAIDAGQQSNTQPGLVFGKSGGTKKFLLMDQGDTFDGVSFSSTLERQGLGIAGKKADGTPVIDPTVIKLCNAVYPIVNAQVGTNIQIRVGGQMHMADTVSWTSYQDFVIGTDRKIDVNLSFALMSIGFKFMDDAAVELNGYGLDVEVVGRF